ncbi:MAG: SUMF1/EgtB/PvdO family nonheme iron enzyme [bacterium]|nr:SUMF1/EgtB/PvdO family nonheme iron enzyme [bacterium]
MKRRFLLVAIVFLAVGLVAQDAPRLRDVGVMAAKGAARAELSSGSKSEVYDFGHYHALLIGVQAYEPHERDLRTARNDVIELERVLKENYQFESTKVLLDEAATRAGILAALDELAGRLDDDDSLLVFFAGHGTKNWTGFEHEEGFWIPYVPRGVEHRWWNWLSARTLNAATARIRARHVLLVSDSCYSGALTREVVAQQNVTSDYVKIHHERSSNQILTSGADEPVSDDGRDGHSIFAYHLLRALKYNNEPCLPASTLADYLIRAIMQDGDFNRGRRSQQPLFAMHPNDKRSQGQMIFVRAGEIAAKALEMQGEPGAPPGYRFPDRVEAVVQPDGSFRYWSNEGGARVEMVLVQGAAVKRGNDVVKIEPFLIDRYEVTNARFDRFLDATGFAVGHRPSHPRLRGARMPATGMNQIEARAFAAWAGRKRLPTTEEWEVAAGYDPEQGRFTRYPWGDDAEAVGLSTGRFPEPVGSHADDRSHFGVEGVGGSVRERCELAGVALARQQQRAVVCGGTQVLKAGHSSDYSIRGHREEVDAAERLEEGRVGLRCVKSLLPPFRR